MSLSARIPKNGFWGRISFLIPAILVACVFIFGVTYIYGFEIDDSFISQRYAENLVDFGRLSYNAGESPQEGYSNFLLVLIEALFVKSGVSGSIIVAKLTGIISGVLVLIVTFKITETLPLFKNIWLRYLPTIALAASTPFIAWAVGGLETLLFTLLVTTGTWLSVRGGKTNLFKTNFLIDLTFLLSVLCRTEGLLFWGLSFLYRLSKGTKERKFITSETRGILAAGLFSGAIFAGYLVWKLFYFGGVLPLPFYVKTASFNWTNLLSGMIKFWFFLKTNLNFIYLIGLIFSVYYALKSKSRDLIYLLTVITLFLLYVFSQGRFITMDYIFRFYVPILPLFYVLGVGGMISVFGGFINNKRISFIKLLLVLFVIAQIGSGFRDLRQAWNVDMNLGSSAANMKVTGMKRLRDEGENSLKTVALKLGKIAPAGSTIVMSDVGLVPYYSRLKVIDVWPLVNKDLVMLHYEYAKIPNIYYERKNEITREMLDYVFDRKPEFILQTGALPILNDSRIKDYAVLPNIKYTYLGEDRYMLCRKDLLPVISSR